MLDGTPFKNLCSTQHSNDHYRGFDATKLFLQKLLIDIEYVITKRQHQQILWKCPNPMLNPILNPLCCY